ncbi:MAG: cobalt ECF transporter T component CbiQ [Chloroflexi bacterium]|nr:cobalt ECF transporter T component CbiQ [Chloroflexota bacterium]
MPLVALLERFYAADSAVHRSDARAKLLCALAYVVVITITPEGDFATLGLLLLPVAAVIAAAKLPPLLLLGRALIALPFLLVALPLLFTRPGEPLATLPLLGWVVSDAGAIAVATILGKSGLAVVVAAVLIATTEAPALLGALRWLRLPRLLVASMEFAYRYLFLVADEASRMLLARASRSASARGRRPGGGLRWRARVAGHLIGTLFVRSIERSERVHAAMLARGYDGEPRRLSSPGFDPRSAAIAAAIVLYGCAVQAAGRL